FLRLARGRQPLVDGLLAGAALGITGGFRPTDAVFLAPAYLWALYCGARGAGKRGLALPVAAGSLLAAAVTTLGWLLPTLASAHGIGPYLEALQGQEHVMVRSSVFTSGWPALRDALFTHLRTLESALGLLWVPVLPALVLRSRLNTQHATPHTLILLLIAPAFLFYLLGHFNAAGYALTYAGLLAALGAGAAARLARGPALPAVAGAVLLGSGLLFWLGWPGVGRIGQRALSRVEIADHDRYYRELRAFLEREDPSGRARVLSSWNFTDGLRVVEALLPERADRVAQAVGARPHLPPAIRRLSWLHLLTPEEVRAGGGPVYAVSRTREDPGYHFGLFPEGWEAVPIGPGHSVLRLKREESR
ncbi:MAG TPA: hypothetical protein VFU47_06830, partial [Armatimonadota bacterium]|nr:hypothetical protein [Armatimonadota bacterium]